METKLLVATKGVVAYRGKILIIRESAAYDEGTRVAEYDLPGGRITPGEDLSRALAREVREETGLEVTVGTPFFANDATPRPIVRAEEWHIVRIFFACTTDRDTVEMSNDHDDYRWIDPRTYRDHGIISNLYPAFEAYLHLIV